MSRFSRQPRSYTLPLLGFWGDPVTLADGQPSRGVLWYEDVVESELSLAPIRRDAMVSLPETDRSRVTEQDRIQVDGRYYRVSAVLQGSHGLIDCRLSAPEREAC